MMHFPRRIGLIVCAVVVGFVAIGSTAGALGQVLSPHNSTTTPPPAADALSTAWDRARATGSYHFDGDVQQVTLPSAIPANVGRTSRSDQFHLEGQSNLRQNALEMQLWSQGGSVSQADIRAEDRPGAVSIKVENGKTYRRQASGTWTEDSSFSTDGIAPQGDFLAFLKAVNNATVHEPETRAGLTFQRYTFEIDGPAFALMVRDQMEASLRQKGELPPGTQLTVPSYYREMTGDGELWVHVGGANDGLPLRQILTLSFPEQRHESVQAQIKINFLDYGQPAAPASAMGFVAALQDQLPALPAIVLPILTLLAIVLLFRFHTARGLQRVLAVTLTISIVMGPALSGIKTATLLDAQYARAATQEKQIKEANAAEGLREIDKTAKFNPHQDPTKAIEQRALAEASLAAARFHVGTSAIASTSEAAPAAQVLPTDNGTDTDQDGLTNFAEARIGTSDVYSDTDGDDVPDGVEVRGFQMGGKTWYLDAQAMDSNGDGIGDGRECWITPPAAGTLASAVPGCDLDTDGDGTPDVFDADNDNDGVPDGMDLSPFTAPGATTFAETTPLKLTLNHLTANKPVFVDFQLRPSDTQHLSFAFNVLDWPHDDKAQVEDIDNKTWADVATAQGRTAAPNESLGDMKLIPMLEIRVPAQTGTPTNLPAQSELSPYNISVNDYVAGGATKVVYVPLNIQTDEKTGMRVAFSGRMRYLPSGTWPSPHEVRLVWVIQALVDVPCDAKAANATASGCAADGYIHNQPQVIQGYNDAWRLTGLNVSENHGTQTAIVYEDPAVDPNLKADTALAGLTAGLDSTFLGGRDADHNGQRDITVSEIARRFDRTANSAISTSERWGMDSTAFNILKVVRRDYATFDQAVIFTAMTETTSLLNNQFNASWTADNTIKPTLMFAYEQQSRALSLDGLRTGNGYVVFSGTGLTVDMQPTSQPQAPLSTMAGMKWAHYCRADRAAAWTICPSDVYWTELDSRMAGQPVYPGDPADPDVAAGRAFITHNYDLVMSQGVNRMVQQDATVLSGLYSMPTDSDEAATVRGALQGASVAIAAVANIVLMAKVVNQISIMKLLGITFSGIKTSAPSKFLISQGLGSNWKVNTAVAGAGILLVGALATTIYFAVEGNLAATIVLKSVIIGLQTFLAVIDPIMTVVAWQGAIEAAGGAALNLSSGVELIGTSRMAGAIGAAIGIAITWGFFIYSMVSNNVSAFSPEFNKALAETIAATIYLILLAVLAATIIGAIIVGIIAVIDAILTAVCELGVDDLRKVPGLGGACFTLGTTAIKAIAYFLYNYELMIDTDRKDLVAPGNPQTTLADPSKGFSAGNSVSITLPITTNISHKSPSVANGVYIYFYLWLFSKDNLRSSTFKYTLTKPGQENLTNVERGQMPSAWQNVGEHHKYGFAPMYGGNTVTTPPPTVFTNLQAGLNQSLPFYLNMGYALPAYECWAIPLFFFYPIPVCYTRTFKGNSSSKIDTLKYDVFPATLDAFMALGNKPDGGLGQSWDPAFPSLKDVDGDGLINSKYGGLDPNDQTWDTDGDGLSDAYELDRRANGTPMLPVACDTDGDGLTDQQEGLYGSNPAILDTDNDGLSDSQEVWHRVYVNCQPTGAWSGGWDVPINATTPFTIHVSSDPSRPDSDGDGISDLAEKQLVASANPAQRVDKQNRPYHPNVFNSSPIVIYNEVSPRYVRPGQSFFYTTTVASSAALGPSALDVSLSPALSGTVPPLALAFSSTQTATQQMTLTVRPGMSTQQFVISNTVRARLAPSGPITYSWDPQIEHILITGTTPAYLYSLAATQPGSQDQYMFTLATGDSFNSTAYGDVRTYAIPTAQERIVYNGVSSTTRHGYNPISTACNLSGNCMIVWDERRPTGVAEAIGGASDANGSLRTLDLMNNLGTQPVSHFFAPVVASDGTGYVVVSEVATDGATPQTRLVAQYFDSNANFDGAVIYTLNAARTTVTYLPTLSLSVIWKGNGYRVAISEAEYAASSARFTVADLVVPTTFGVTTGTLTPLLLDATAYHHPDTLYARLPEPSAQSYDPNTNRTMIVWRAGDNSIHTIAFNAATLPAVPPAYGTNTSSSVNVVYNPMLRRWMMDTYAGLKFYNSDAILDNSLGLPAAGSTNFFACPAPESEPVLDLRFEDAPQSTTFVDGSAKAQNATCSGANTCPVSGLPGATNASQIAVGTPSSDYSAYFDGIDDTLVLTSPVVPAQDNFSVSFWYSSTRAGAATFPISIGTAKLSINTGSLNFQVGTVVVNAPFNATDGQWHYIVATYNKISNTYVIYVDGVNRTSASSSFQAAQPSSAFVVLGGQASAPSSLDEFKIHRTALSASVVQAIYAGTQQSYCATGFSYTQSGAGNGIKWFPLNARASDPRGGKITTSSTYSISIDADVPTSTLVGLSNGQYIAGNTTHIIGGNAGDRTSGIARVEVNTNGAGFQLANGSETWAYNLTVGEGTYALKTRATDVAGNVETPGAGITVIADGTAPNVTLNVIPAAPVVPTQNANGQWVYAFSGTVSDPVIGAQLGSGVAAGSVEVRLQGSADNAQGNGWQTATLSSGVWMISYTLPAGLIDPTGTYTVSVRAADNIGNHTSDAAATGLLYLDGIGPTAALSDVDSARVVISNTLALSGIVTDTGSAGINALDVAFISVDDVLALPEEATPAEAEAQLTRTWLTAKLAQRGAGITQTTWSITVPAGLENMFQLDLRGRDMLSNSLITSNVWRGVIDTLAPRVAMTATATGNSYKDPTLNKRLYQVTYACVAVDQYLDDASFRCPGNALQPPTRVLTNQAALNRLFPDLTLRTGMVNTYTLWQTSPIPAVQMQACDSMGHCATASLSSFATVKAGGATGFRTFGAQSLSAAALAKPSAIVIAPNEGSYVAAASAAAATSTTSISVTVAAETDQPLHEIVILLDGTAVVTTSFAQTEGITETQRTVAIPISTEGPHTLIARATDWAGTVQATDVPVHFILDTQLPVATLDTSTLTISDTWQLESGILRFRGTATDSVGLAAVQVQVNDMLFADAVFKNGEWRTALPISDPEGKTLSVTVRAIDFAGQRTTVFQRLGTNLSSADAPDTTITSGPANPSAVTTATIVFTGTSLVREVAAFDCQIDEGVFEPCVSPLQMVDVSNGPHTVNVRAIDSQGHADLSPASLTWTVDIAALKTTITAAPTSTTNSRAASLAFTGSTGTVSFECALDTEVFTACTSPQAYAGLADGPHTFRVRARNGVGQTGASTRVVWTILNAVPVASSQAVTTTEDQSVDITLMAVDADANANTLLFTVDPPAHGVLQGIPPNVRYKPDTNFVGTDTFTFRASDATADSATATVTITVSDADVDAPTSVISLTPAMPLGQNGWFTSSVHVVVSATDGISPKATGVTETRCVLNPLTPPMTFGDVPAGCAYLGAGANVSANGVYTVYAASRDPINHQETPISQTFRLDAMPPAVQVTGVMSGASYTVGAVPAAACLTTDALSGVAVSATVNVSGGDAQGLGQFMAACSGAIDQAGNRASVMTATYLVNDVVGVPPVSTITLMPSKPNGQNGWFTNTVHGVVSATDGTDPTATGVAETRCSLNPLTQPMTFGDLPASCAYLGAGADVSADGIYTAYAASRDTKNNIEIPISQTFRLDTMPPVVRVAGIVDGASYTAGAVPAATCMTSDALSGVAVSAIVSVSGGDAQGLGQFVAACSGAIDQAGNLASTVTATYSVSDVIGVPPVSTITLIPAQPNGQSGWFTSSVHVVVSATDGTDPTATGVAETRCVLNPLTQPTTLGDMPASCAYLGAGANVSTDGIYTAYAASRDTKNNIEIPISQTFRLDTMPPTVIVTGVMNGASYAVGAVPAATCMTTDALSGVAISATLSVSGGDAQGLGQFVATCSGAIDQAGNPSTVVTATYSIHDETIDESPVSVLTLMSAAPMGQNGWFTVPVHIVVNGGDEAQRIRLASLSAVETRCVLNPSTQPETFDDLPVGCAYLGAGADVSADGVYTLYAASRDSADQFERPVSLTFRLDMTPPVVRMISVVNGGRYVVGYVPPVICLSTDDTSGVATPATSGLNIGIAQWLGEYTVTCSGATDNAGNTADSVSATYTVAAFIILHMPQLLNPPGP